MPRFCHCIFTGLLCSAMCQLPLLLCCPALRSHSPALLTCNDVLEFVPALLPPIEVIEERPSPSITPCTQHPTGCRAFLYCRPVLALLSCTAVVYFCVAALCF